MGEDPGFTFFLVFCGGKMEKIKELLPSG